MAEDLRSLRSEYDYGSKRKFVDVLGNVSMTSKLNKVALEKKRQQQDGKSDIAISAMSFKSFVSKQSGASRLSKQSVAALRLREAKRNKLTKESADAIEAAPSEVIPESVAEENED